MMAVVGGMPGGKVCVDSPTEDFNSSTLFFFVPSHRPRSAMKVRID